MTVIVPEYWPPISHVAQLYKCDEVQLQVGGTYQKQSFLNRCSITGVHGELTLSVPLIGGREQKTLFQKVQIDNQQRWATQQLRTLRSCYGKAPFFDYYFPGIQEILTQPNPQLAILNEKILEQIIAWLKWKGKLIKSEDFSKPMYGSSIMLKEYVQVFADRQPFKPDLSILDLLFCTGPAAVSYLKL